MIKMQIHQLVVGMVATNCYIIENTQNHECLVIDPGDGAEAIIQEIASKHLQPIAVLLTHGHFDHTGAAQALKEQYGISVYAHEAERETLEKSELNLSGPMAGRGQSYRADVFLKDEQEIDLAGFHIRVLFTPGHTAGGCSYYIPMEEAVFSGDSLFCGSIGRTDFPGGSASTLVRAVKDKLMVLPERTTVYPGHDARTTIEQERMYNPFL